MSKKALFIAGGWGGHEPIETSKFIIQEIKKFDIDSELVESLDVMSDLKYLKKYFRKEVEKLETLNIDTSKWRDY